MTKEKSADVCAAPNCSHPMSDHVKDRVMEGDFWITVQRCLVCEKDGGPCTDPAMILKLGPDVE